MLSKLSEPILVIIAGGTVLVQAIMQMLLAFNVPITPQQQAAIMTLAGILLPLLARNYSTPTNALPPGVAATIADKKALAGTGG
jgi:hypothetical protein